MSKTLDQGRDEIARLCGYFQTNRDRFLAPGVKEAHIRQNLIDPFFEALGWDVANRAMIAPQYREVIPEDSLDVEGTQKAPDYTFRVGPLPKFYVEAKKCGVNIKSDAGPAYQLRRYGWSAKVAVSILTDFEELAVYECTTRPRENDKASHARILYFTYQEYSERWRELWDVFSREAVWSGAFDQYAASKRKRGTSEVDVEFLKELERWREALARNMALRNAALSSEDLNAAVQLTIDRVVFLRMAEDRGLEPYEQLLKLCERDDIYLRFMRNLCRKADEKYNSGLFHFQNEAGVAEAPDRITPKLAVDDKVFKPILQSLYFRHGSPYHFGVMPVEILGTVYERFLGKVIRLTAGHQAKIEEKPEVRKAGGVYYTPAHIVEYIVKQTVGKQIEGRSPAQLDGGTKKPAFRVLDMACGSGSFLLGAYQYLLDHCLKWYVDNKPNRHKRAVYEDHRNKHWRLTIEEKKRILTAHLFGVDLDPQAVEVTKLSLLLKALEGENDTTLALQLRLFHERALPNLAENIKCGNSLIEPNYFRGSLIPEPDDIGRLKAFDWQKAFPEAIAGAKGFDCIIGNPPYVDSETMTLAWPGMRELIHANYKMTKGNWDTYIAFFERGFTLLRKTGLLSFITPDKWLAKPFGDEMRRQTIDKIVSLLEAGRDVFEDANVDAIVSVFSNTRHPSLVVYDSMTEGAPPKRTVAKAKLKPPYRLDWLFSDYVELLEKIETQTGRLEDIGKCENACATSDAYKLKPLVQEQPVSNNERAYLKIVNTGTIDKYVSKWGQRKMVYLGNEYIRPVVERSAFLRAFANSYATKAVKQKIIIKGLNLLDGCLDEAGETIPGKTTLILTTNDINDLKLLLAIINSAVAFFYIKEQNRAASYNKGTTFTKEMVNNLPVPRLSPTDRKALVAVVDRLISTKNRQPDADVSVLQREIDRVLYERYGLTNDEVAIIERSKR